MFCILADSSDIMMENFTLSGVQCVRMLRWSRIDTLNGKFEMIVFAILFMLILPSNGLLIYGMLKTKEIKNNTARYSKVYFLKIEEEQGENGN